MRQEELGATQRRPRRRCCAPLRGDALDALDAFDAFVIPPTGSVCFCFCYLFQIFHRCVYFHPPPRIQQTSNEFNSIELNWIELNSFTIQLRLEWFWNSRILTGWLDFIDLMWLNVIRCKWFEITWSMNAIKVKWFKYGRIFLDVDLIVMIQFNSMECNCKWFEIVWSINQ